MNPDPPETDVAPIGVLSMSLPELECVCRWVASHAVGARVRAVHVASPRLLTPVGYDAAALTDQTLQSCVRVGRHVILRFERDALALVVRGPSALFVGALGRDVPACWRLALEMGTHSLWLCDEGAAARAVGTSSDGAPASAEDAARAVDAQGVEPLSATFTFTSFKKVLRYKRRTMARLLVDGTLIAGIGGAYADEILYASRVRPTRSAPSLGDEELQNVYYAILEVLQKSIRFGGLDDAQQPFVEGQPGRFRRFLNTHGRKGAPCRACGARIRLTHSDDLAAFYCPRCQR